MAHALNLFVSYRFVSLRLSLSISTNHGHTAFSDYDVLALVEICLFSFSSGCIIVFSFGGFAMSFELFYDSAGCKCFPTYECIIANKEYVQ